MDGAKKTLLATVFTAAITASAAAYAGVISVPEFNLSIPTPDQSAPSQPGQNMAIPTIPSGAQIPTTTQLPPSVAALPSIATSGQSGVPIYGNPVPSTDSTGASGATQNLASSCYASGGSWNPSTSTCSTNSTSSISSQCAQMGGQYDWTKNQCQMASLPGSGSNNPYGWPIGAHLAASDWLGQVVVRQLNGKAQVYLPNRRDIRTQKNIVASYVDVSGRTMIQPADTLGTYSADPFINVSITPTGVNYQICVSEDIGTGTLDTVCHSKSAGWVR
jgi:hypothetical protein